MAARTPSRSLLTMPSNVLPLPTLRPGALIAVVAPAGPAPAEAVARVPAVIESMGYRARLYPGCHERLPFLAGPDARRRQDLMDAFADPEIDAVFCLRGGYGSGRLLDQIDWQAVLSRPKPFIGYSDITALQAQFTNAGLVTFHGPMLTSDLVRSTLSPEAHGYGILRDGLVAGTVWQPALEPSLLTVPGRASGKLVGGNLNLIVSLLGTPYALDLRDSLLFLEEVGEAPYRVDRFLQQLRLSGALALPRGFVLGRFSDAESPADVLADYLTPLGKPVLGGWPAGHGPGATVLPLGADVTIDAHTGTLTFLQTVLAPAPAAAQAS